VKLETHAVRILEAKFRIEPLALVGAAITIGIFQPPDGRDRMDD